MKLVRQHFDLKKRKKKLGEEHLQRIIDLCKSVEERSIDPFLVEVDDIVTVIREYFSEWESLDEFNLDAEAVNRLASVIKLQSDWVRHRSTSLYPARAQSASELSIYHESWFFGKTVEVDIKVITHMKGF